MEYHKDEKKHEAKGTVYLELASEVIKVCIAKLYNDEFIWTHLYMASEKYNFNLLYTKHTLSNKI